ncbi:MAG: radical SAM protein [candidate division WOR-3 bacterium]
MSNLYLSFNPNYKIKKRGDYLFLYSKDFSEISGVKPLAPIEAIILIYCDGTKTYEEVINFAKSLISSYSLKEEDFKNLKIIINTFIKNQILLKSPFKKKHNFDYNLSEILSCKIPDSPKVIHLEIPIGFGLLLTHKCPFCCVYCYAKTIKSNEKEEYISLDRLLKIFSEAKDLEIESVAISGGEPFSYPKIFDIIKEILQMGIFPIISTKFPLKEKEISYLKKLGLKKIQVSLDSHKEEIVNSLLGVPNYFSSIINTIKTLISYNIEVRINCVLTKETIKDIDNFIYFLYELGIRQLGLAPYSANLSHYDFSLFPAKEEYKKLKFLLKKIKKELPDFLVHYFCPIELEEKLKRKEFEWCSAGRFGFAILPNGKVTICEQLTTDDFIVGDLNYQGIMDIWNSDNMLNFRFPKREYFKDTECYYCEEFEECSKYQGRCYLRTLIVFNRIFAPDPFCPKVSDKVNFRQW